MSSLNLVFSHFCFFLISFGQTKHFQSAFQVPSFFRKKYLLANKSKAWLRFQSLFNKLNSFWSSTFWPPFVHSQKFRGQWRRPFYFKPFLLLLLLFILQILILFVILQDEWSSQAYYMLSGHFCKPSRKNKEKVIS